MYLCGSMLLARCSFLFFPHELYSISVSVLTHSISNCGLEYGALDCCSGYLMHLEYRRVGNSYRVLFCLNERSSIRSCPLLRGYFFASQ
ncbi:hypothetical protein HOY80DRAFT_521396 [Tuber brumale]|nr:hypothetical protein HOY80DRAFT_521396 [Tuber brumale]